MNKARVELTVTILKNLKINKPYLLAVSGGQDSMVLLQLLTKLKYTFEVAHVNYNLRGADSIADQQLVENYCLENNIYCHTHNEIDTNKYCQDNKVAIQEGARNIRYTFFKNVLAANKKMQGLITAHHALDNIETVLIHIGRGTGFNGLIGMQTQAKVDGINIYRPLINTSKETIEAYCEEERVKYRTDTSNAKNIYTRNAIRNQLIPLWQQIEPRFVPAMQGNINLWNQNLDIFNTALNKQVKKVVLLNNNTFKLLIKVLQSLPNNISILYKALEHFDFSVDQLQEILNLCNSENGKYVATKKYKAIKHNYYIVIQAIEENMGLIYVESFPFKTMLKNSFVELVETKLNAIPASGFNVDKDVLQLPLVIRPTVAGDYFYPLGLNKKKKISKYLIDIKIPVQDRQNQLVLCSGDKIVALLGHRLDHRFRITKENTTAIQINYKQND